jgi:hypothetical protein
MLIERKWSLINCNEIKELDSVEDTCKIVNYCLRHTWILFMKKFQHAYATVQNYTFLKTYLHFSIR